MGVKINHIALNVENIEATYEWFKKYFGFTKILMPGKVEIKAGIRKGFRCSIGNKAGDVLELNQYEGEYTTPDNKKGAINHLSFTVDDVEDYYKILLEDGFLIGGEKLYNPGPVKILYFTGINGIELELIEIIGRD